MNTVNAISPNLDILDLTPKTQIFKIEIIIDFDPIDLSNEDLTIIANQLNLIDNLIDHLIVHLIDQDFHPEDLPLHHLNAKAKDNFRHFKLALEHPSYIDNAVIITISITLIVVLITFDDHRQFLSLIGPQFDIKTNRNLVSYF